MFWELQLRVERLEARVRTQDAVINQLCEHLGLDAQLVDPQSQLDDEERLLLAQGKKVQAIKHHRKRTGSSLIMAKQAIDAASRED